MFTRETDQSFSNPSSLENSPEKRAQVANHLLPSREAVGVFEDDDHLRAAIDDLEMAEFARHDISVLGSEDDMQRTYHQSFRKADDLMDDPDAPRGAFVMPEEQGLAEAALVGGGILIATIIAAPMMVADMNIPALLTIAAFGGLMGYLAAVLLRHMRHRRLNGQRQKGGLLLWVNTPTREMERKATSILSRHGARNVHVHEMDRHAV